MSPNYRTPLHLTVIAVFGLMGATGHAFAATSQQQKMTTCNAEAKTKNLKGDDRKAFMKNCLSATAARTNSMTTQQTKMKTCNAQASSKALKGDERKQFMKACLSGPQAATPPQ